MNHVTINNKEYTVPEIDFDTICTLEENGVYLLNMDRKNPKIATMLRGIVAWIMDVEPERASREIQEHIQGGGDIGSILSAVTQAVTSSGFFSQSHQANSGGKTVNYEGNREQRRRNNKNRRNTTT